MQQHKDEHQKDKEDDKADDLKEKTIFVNNKKLLVKENYLTGKEILERANFDPDQYDLYLVHGQKSEPIKLDQKVHIVDDMHFNAIRKDVPYG